MAQLNEKEQKIVKFIKADKVMKKYMRKDGRYSGSIWVPPITIWSNDIEIQLNWDARPNYFKGFILIFNKCDGQCPSNHHVDVVIVTLC